MQADTLIQREGVRFPLLLLLPRFLPDLAAAEDVAQFFPSPARSLMTKTAANVFFVLKPRLQSPPGKLDGPALSLSLSLSCVCECFVSSEAHTQKCHTVLLLKRLYR